MPLPTIMVLMLMRSWFMEMDITLAVHIMSQILGPCTKPCASKVECKPGCVRIDALHGIMPFKVLPSCDRLSSSHRLNMAVSSFRITLHILAVIRFLICFTSRS
jgi:hypothetical protein